MQKSTFSVFYMVGQRLQRSETFFHLLTFFLQKSTSPKLYFCLEDLPKPKCNPLDLVPKRKVARPHTHPIRIKDCCVTDFVENGIVHKKMWSKFGWYGFILQGTCQIHLLPVWNRRLHQGCGLAMDFLKPWVRDQFGEIFCETAKAHLHLLLAQPLVAEGQVISDHSVPVFKLWVCATFLMLPIPACQSLLHLSLPACPLCKACCVGYSNEEAGGWSSMYI